jgi:DNA-binding MarR family transcriptional regulator
MLNRKILASKLLVGVLVILLILFNLNCRIDAKVFEETEKHSFEQSSIVITTHETRINFLDPQEIIVDESIFFECKYAASISLLEYWINHSYSELEITDEQGILNYDISNTTGLISINLRNNLYLNQSSYFRISYKLDVDPLIIEGKPSYYYFQFRNDISYFTEFQKVTVRLPSFCYLHEDEDIEHPIYPDDADISIIGEKILLTWEFEELQYGSNPLIFILFEKPVGTPKIWPIIVGPLLGLIAGAVGVFFLMRKKERKIYSDLDKVYITNSQRTLLSLINDLDGKTTQKVLIDVTGFSKSKISRNLTPLEEKDLIYREKWGREFKVFITVTGRRLIKKLVAEKLPDSFKEEVADISKGEEQL